MFSQAENEQLTKRRKKEFKPCGTKYQAQIHQCQSSTSWHRLQTWRHPSTPFRVRMKVLTQSNQTMMVRLIQRLKQMGMFSQLNHKVRWNATTARESQRNGESSNVGTLFAYLHRVPINLCWATRQQKKSQRLRMSCCIMPKANWENNSIVHWLHGLI